MKHRFWNGSIRKALSGLRHWRISAESLYYKSPLNTQLSRCFSSFYPLNSANQLLMHAESRIFLSGVTCCLNPVSLEGACCRAFCWEFQPWPGVVSDAASRACPCFNLHAHSQPSHLPDVAETSAQQLHKAGLPHNRGT